MKNARYLVVSLLLVVLVSAVGLSKETLTIYTAYDADQAQVYIEAFEVANPDIDVEWVRLSSGEVYTRLTAEASNPQASLWFGGSNTSHIAAAKAGLLEPYTESLAWQYISPQFKDPTGLWIGAPTACAAMARGLFPTCTWAGSAGATKRWLPTEWKYSVPKSSSRVNPSLFKTPGGMHERWISPTTLGALP